MKTKVQLLTVVLAGFVIVAFSGCAGFRKNRSSVPVPTTPPPVTAVQQSPVGANGSPQGQPSVGQLGNQSGNQSPSAVNNRRPRWATYSAFDNLFDIRSPVYSDATVLFRNHRTDNIVIQVSDRTIAAPNDAGQLAVMVLPPGEPFALRDYGFGPSTVVYALILDDNDNPVSYLSASVRWPQRGRQWGREERWDILPGDSIPLSVTTSPVKLPNADTNASAVTLLQNLRQTLSQVPALVAPPAGAPAPASPGSTTPLPATRTP